eukprot:TRINITY_DN344_c0_g2_i1.p1 TRINITY_DN344_c0_g2~~TRINITY_DN344_c0_g2_i1.p1  ORF type:complete len:198 (+),score=31.29 TRINITY_DN344_c0_g2_i1:20-613(+)
MHSFSVLLPFIALLSSSNAGRLIGKHITTVGSTNDVPLNLDAIHPTVHLTISKTSTIAATSEALDELFASSLDRHTFELAHSNAIDWNEIKTAVLSAMRSMNAYVDFQVQTDAAHLVYMAVRSHRVGNQIQVSLSGALATTTLPTPQRAVLIHHTKKGSFFKGTKRWTETQYETRGWTAAEMTAIAGRMEAACKQIV